MSLIKVELLCDTGTNCFIMNNPDYLHDLIVSLDKVGITRGTNTTISYNRILHLHTNNQETRMIIQIKNIL